MAIAEADRSRLSYIAEVTPGTTPSGSLQRMRITGDTLAQVSETKDSEQINDDGQVQEVMRSFHKAEGTIKFEIPFGSHDDMFKALSRSAGWSSSVTVGPSSAISAAAADNSFNSAGGLFSGLSVYQWIKSSGWATAANNGYFKIVSQTANKIIVQGKTLVNEATGVSVTILQGEQVVTGTTKTHFSFERAMNDLSNEFAVFTMMLPKSGNLNFTAEQMCVGEIAFEGRQEVSATATIGTGYTAFNNNPVMNVVDNIISFLCDSDGTVLADYAGRSFTIAINENLRARSQMGDGGPISFGYGNFKPTGTLECYYDNKKLIDKYLNFQDVAFAQVIEDGNGKAYVFDIPRAKLTAGTRNAASQNTDIMKNVNWSAYKHPTEGITMRIVRFP